MPGAIDITQLPRVTRAMIEAGIEEAKTHTLGEPLQSMVERVLWAALTEFAHENTAPPK